MKHSNDVRALIALASTILLGIVSTAAGAAIQFTPITQAGFSSPVFVGNAGDGSNRLFVVEQAGVIRFVQPGATTSSVFLDIRSKVLAGGERGLLGLAFHPSFRSNGRFFVYYTRVGDGAIVVGEYRVPTSTPSIAAIVETVILTIPHPSASNHNGGMLAFGPDGYLYIGVGDGGSANDPPNNAQNRQSLLGKILRINIDDPDTVNGRPYSSPSGNPHVPTNSGRHEIYSLGWRNPWRFSFDRGGAEPRALWVADVGQGAREEVNTPVIAGGNYGWRVYEGAACTGNDPSLCNPANFIPPLFEYTHSGGRCSITGGYVYRGRQAVLPAGTYVYGDYCTGEIFAWDGAQTVIADTAMSISSFGEDEQGELYVVDIKGQVNRIESTTPAPVVVEFYNAALDHYFVTADADEAAGIDAGRAGPGWTRTGFTFKSGGSVQVCRFYGSVSPGPNSHFYTADIFNECAMLRQLQNLTPVTQKRWNFEGTGFASTPSVSGAAPCAAGTVPVYRAYNDGFARGVDSNHRLTTSLAAINEVAGRGWQVEGVAMCAPQ